MKRKKTLVRATLLALFAITFILASCSKNQGNKDITDYSTTSNWLEANISGNNPVDVFYLCPTTYRGSDISCEVTDEGMRDGAKEVRIMQTSVFDGTANVFMPYYRQSNAALALALPIEEQEKLIAQTPAKDCIEAFEYYLKHYNNGRPFFLAGHSQGSDVMLHLLAYLRNRPDVMMRMVASYCIGYAVTINYLAKNPHLKFAEKNDDTGVIISWNSEYPGVTAKNPVVASPKNTMVINPISWSRETTIATASQSLGSRMYEGGAYIDKPSFADAQIDLTRGAVVCSTVDPNKYLSSSLFPIGVLHSLDYNLFYYDLKQNIKDRFATFQNK